MSMERQQTLAQQLARCADVSARPDLALRLVELLLLLAPPSRHTS